METRPQILKKNSLESGFTFKVEIVGDKGSGKSSLLTKYYLDIFPAINADCRTKMIDLDYVHYGVEVKLDIWDIHGSDAKYKLLNNPEVRGTHAIVLVLDLSNSDSFQFANVFLNDTIHTQFNRGLVIALVGTKCDQVPRKINPADIIKIENEIENAGIEYLGYFETSAIHGTNVKEIFNEIASDLTFKYTPVEMKQNEYVSYLQEQEAEKIVLEIKARISDRKNPLPTFWGGKEILLDDGGLIKVAEAVASHWGYIKQAEKSVNDRRRYYKTLIKIQESSDEAANEFSLSRYLFRYEKTNDYYKNNCNIKLFHQPAEKKSEFQNKFYLYQKQQEYLTKPSNPLLCPISMEMMVDPVIVVTSGNTYDRQCILQWFHNNAKWGYRNDKRVEYATDPLTRVEFTLNDIIANKALKEVIDERRALSQVNGL